MLTRNYSISLRNGTASGKHNLVPRVGKRRDTGNKVGGKRRIIVVTWSFLPVVVYVIPNLFNNGFLLFQIGHLSLGWALGFMINATNLLPLLPASSVPINVIQTGVYLAVVIVGAFLISAGLLVCIMSAGRIYRRRQLNLRGLVL